MIEPTVDCTEIQIGVGSLDLVRTVVVFDIGVLHIFLNYFLMSISAAFSFFFFFLCTVVV